MKKLIISGSLLVAVVGLVAGATFAFFNDTETSTGNIFIAGAIDLTVDHTFASYNGEECVGNCQEIGSERIENGGFEDPNIPSHTWNVYPTGIPGWTVVSGAGIEVQDNVAGAPHSGGQHIELDSNNSSSMSQTINTIPSGKYRFSFWHSPRPNRPAGDNTIGYTVKVTSNSGIIIDDTVGASVAGGSNTQWQLVTYDFIALDTQTTIIFSDVGTNNSFGGYLDDVSVRELECTEHQYTYGGVCQLWNERDISDSEYFWNFTDVKPGDHGVSVISLHVYDNDAHVCLFPQHGLQDVENGITDPEVEASDTTPVEGELSQFVKLFAWYDLDNDGLFEPNDSETAIGSPTGNTPIQTEIVQLSLVGNTPAELIGLAWCVGEQNVATNGVISCDGSGNQDIAQTDSIETLFTAYAEQVRNNEGFACVDVVLN